MGEDPIQELINSYDEMQARGDEEVMGMSFMDMYMERMSTGEMQARGGKGPRGRMGPEAQANPSSMPSYEGRDGGTDPINRLAGQQMLQEQEVQQAQPPTPDYKNPGYNYENNGASTPTPGMPYIPGTNDRMPVVPSNHDSSGHSTLL